MLLGGGNAGTSPVKKLSNQSGYSAEPGDAPVRAGGAALGHRAGTECCSQGALLSERLEERTRWGRSFLNPMM